MKVSLEQSITDHLAKRRYSVYRREDGKYWVLAVPTNPWTATKDNVLEFVRDTKQAALDLVGTRP